MRRALPGLAWALFALLLAAPSTCAKGIEAQRGPALDHLADRVEGSGSLAANIAEAAHANGLALDAWPSPGSSVAQAIVVPGEGASNVSLLRPLRALALAGDPRAAADGALTQRVLANFRDDGYGDPRALNDDAYAILALAAIGSPAGDAPVQAARAHLLANQRDDGGWGWAVGAPSGTDMTGLVVAALATSGGVPDTTTASATAFLTTTRTTAGFAETPGGSPNCESTVWGLRATDLLGGTPRDADWWFLLGLQREDGGFAHVPGASSDLLCTSEAAALLGEADAGLLPGPSMRDDGIPAPGAVWALAALACAAGLRLRRP